MLVNRKGILFLFLGLLFARENVKAEQTEQVELLDEGQTIEAIIDVMPQEIYVGEDVVWMSSLSKPTENEMIIKRTWQGDYRTTYEEPGYYEVRLIVEDTSGATDEAIFEFEVKQKELEDDTIYQESTETINRENTIQTETSDNEDNYENFETLSDVSVCIVFSLLIVSVLS